MASFIEELKRRNVVRVGLAYVVIAWVVAQAAELSLDSFEAPDWVIKTVLLLLALGLPIALFFAWAFELTPEGIKKEKDVDRSQSITPQTGRKLDFVIIGVLSIALAWFAWDKFAVDSEGTDEVAASDVGDGVGRQAAGQDAFDATIEQTGRVAAEKSVAVLPFVAMSSGEDDGFFADGLTEEILNALAQLPELLVTARTSAFSFKGQDLPVQEIAEALNVRHIVEGSVRRSGERLRVTAQLIRAEDGFHLWSENYDSESGDIIEVQEDIATEIASSLDVYLDEARLERMRDVGLRDPQAFIDFQKGLDLFNRAHGELDTITALTEANGYFNQVIARVPHFDKAYILRTDLPVHALQEDQTSIGSNPVHDARMEQALASTVADYEAAMQYAKSPERRASYAFDLAFITGDWRGLKGRIEAAMADDGCDINSWLVHAALPFGYAEQFLVRTKRELACDPLRTLSWFNVARAAFWSNDRQAALSYAQEGLEKAPGAWLAMMTIHLLVAEGRYEDAERIIDSRLQRENEALTYKALVAAQQGDAKRHRELIEEFKAEFIGSGKDLEGNEFWLLSALAWGGLREEANAVAAIIDGSRIGPFSLAGSALWCGCGAPWDLEATPQFAKKLEESGVPWPPAPLMQYTLKDW